MERRARTTIVLCASAALLSACGPSLPSAPAMAPAPFASSARHAGEAERSWMSPDAQNEALLYVGNVWNVTVYSYPQGKLEGTLTGDFYRTSGECVDAKGDVFITNEGNGAIIEYGHGRTKPKEVLHDPIPQPAGCAIDPTTGNLAVTSLGNQHGAVAIYQDARGNPTTYSSDAFAELFFCGYDDKGNLFFDGLNASFGFMFGELPKGGSSIKVVTLNQSIGWPAGVQWDGKYVVVGDQTTPVLYRFAVKGSRGTSKETISLGGDAYAIYQFFIDGSTVIVPNEYFTKTRTRADVLFYDYPAGGKVRFKLRKGEEFPEGVVVSPA